MKKNIVLFLLLLNTLRSLYAADGIQNTNINSAGTELEKLWNLARKNSLALHSATSALEYAELEFLNRRSLHPFSLRLNLDSAFNDNFPDVSAYPVSTKASITLSKQNSYGSSISTGLSYSLGRSISDYFADSFDSENIAYSHTPELSLNLSQNLFVARIKSPEGKIISAQFQLLKNNIESASNSVKETEFNLFKDVSDCYIKIRCNLRELNKYKKYLDFYEKKISAAKELYFDSKLSASEIWNLENKKWENYKNYLECLAEKENIELTLKQLCGNLNFEIQTNEAFPCKDAFLFGSNFEKRKISLDIENLKIKFQSERQTSSPVLSLGGTFSENTKANKNFTVNYIEEKSGLNWSFSLGLSFSDFLSTSQKLKKSAFETNLLLYQEKLKKNKEDFENKKENLIEVISSYQKKAENLKEIKEKRKQFYDDYKLLFTSGKCSELDLQEIQLSLIETEVVYQSICDYLWFYQWLEVQYK